MRKAIPRKVRKEVYEKYEGHCAYCGCKIEYKEMQVDHIVAYAESIYGGNSEDVKEMIKDGSINSIDNLMPSCRQCNFYKGIYNIDGFRNRIKNTLSNTCTTNFNVKLAMKYGILQYKEWDEKFYFEQKK